MAKPSRRGWLIKYQDGANATRTRQRSPIPVLTRCYWCTWLTTVFAVCIHQRSADISQ